MKAMTIIGTSLVLLCLVLTSGCAGCNDELDAGCTSNDDCRVGRMCIEEACAPAPDGGAALDDEDSWSNERPPREDASVPDGAGGQPVTPSESIVEEYCDMEAACIPFCSSRDGEVACDSPERASACPQEFVRKYESLTSQSTRCAQTVDAWFRCISAASCGEVEEFFLAHPDGVTEQTPCSQEYFKMECTDFEPVTEYGFPR